MADKKYELEINSKATGDGLRKSSEEAKQLESTVGTANSSLGKFEIKSGEAGAASRQMGSKIANASFQVQDFAVQIASGQGAMRAFTQQAPQFLQIFGPGGAIAGAVLAGAPLLYTFFDTAGEKAAKAKKANEDFADSLEDLTGFYKDLAKAENQALEDSRKISSERIAAVKQEVDFRLAAARAETERDKRQIAADGTVLIALERLRIAGLEAAAVHASGEDALKFATQRKAAAERIAAIEAGIAEKTRQAEETAAQKRVEESGTVDTVAREELAKANTLRQQALDNYNGLNDELTKEVSARRGLVEQLQQQLAAAQVERDKGPEGPFADFDEMVGRAAVHKAELDAKIARIEQALRDADVPSDLTKDLTARTAGAKTTLDQAANTLAEAIKSKITAETASRSAQQSLDQTQANNAQGRDIETNQRAVGDLAGQRSEIQGKLNQAEQTGAEQVNVAIDQILAQLGGLANSPEVQAKAEQLRAMMKDGLQAAEKDQTLLFLKELQGKIAADNSKRGQVWNQVVNMLDTNIALIEAQQNQLVTLEGRLAALESRITTARPN